MESNATEIKPVVMWTLRTGVTNSLFNFDAVMMKQQIYLLFTQNALVNKKTLNDPNLKLFQKLHYCQMWTHEQKVK